MTSPRDFLVTDDEDDRYGYLTGHTEFFPTDLINAEPPRTKKERLAEMIVDLVEESSEKDEDNRSFLTRQAHIADLIWLAKELKGTLVTWGSGDDELHNAVAKERVRLLSSTLDKRIGEIG